MNLEHKEAYIRFTMKGCPYCIMSEHGWKEANKTRNEKYAKHANKVMLNIEQEYIKDFKLKNPDGTEIEVESFPTYAYFKNGVMLHNYTGPREGPELIKEIVKRLKLTPKSPGKTLAVKRARKYSTKTRLNRTRH